MPSLFLYFEVLDKEPSSMELWLFYLACAAIGFLLCRFAFWLVVLVIPINLLFGLVWLTELHDEYIGPAIIQEAGYNYVIQSYLAILTAILLPGAGAYISWKKQFGKTKGIENDESPEQRKLL